MVVFKMLTVQAGYFLLTLQAHESLPWTVFHLESLHQLIATAHLVKGIPLELKQGMRRLMTSQPIRMDRCL